MTGDIPESSPLLRPFCILCLHALACGSRHLLCHPSPCWPLPPQPCPRRTLAPLCALGLPHTLQARALLVHLCPVPSEESGTKQRPSCWDEWN